MNKNVHTTIQRVYDSHIGRFYHMDALIYQITLKSPPLKLRPMSGYKLVYNYYSYHIN